MTRVIAFFNQKGGTAKTTTTLNVAAALAQLGRRVLTIDLDPQASLTMAVGVDIAALDGSVYDLLLDEDVAIADVVCATTIANVELAPSHPDLAAAELELLNVLERTVVLSPADTIRVEDLPDRLLAPPERAATAAPDKELSLEELERRHIEQVLSEAATLEDAAARLGINPTTLWRKRRRYGIE